MELLFQLLFQLLFLFLCVVVGIILACLSEYSQRHHCQHGNGVREENSSLARDSEEQDKRNLEEAGIIIVTQVPSNPCG